MNKGTATVTLIIVPELFWPIFAWFACTDFLRLIECGTTLFDCEHLGHICDPRVRHCSTRTPALPFGLAPRSYAIDENFFHD